jgi:hypothetical protein
MYICTYVIGYWKLVCNFTAVARDADGHIVADHHDVLGSRLSPLAFLCSWTCKQENTDRLEPSEAETASGHVVQQQTGSYQQNVTLFCQAVSFCATWPMALAYRHHATLGEWNRYGFSYVLFSASFSRRGRNYDTTTDTRKSIIMNQYQESITSNPSS